MGSQVMEPLAASTNEPLIELRTRHGAGQHALSEELRLDRALAVYVTERPRLFAIAYRILNSVSDAEDVLQEVWLRWQRTDRQIVDNPQAFLVTATGRLAINVTQGARSRRESSASPWLEDLGGIARESETTAERIEAAELIVRVLMERTNATERAAYLLRRGFGYPYRKVAEILQLGAANARQLVHRAHLRIHTSPPRPVQRTTYQRLVRAFLAASQHGDLASLETVLTADIRQNTLRGPDVSRHPSRGRPIAS